MIGVTVKHQLAAHKREHTRGARGKLSEPRELVSPPKQRETKASDRQRNTNTEGDTDR